MSKLGLPYLPKALMLTKISLNEYSADYPTYLLSISMEILRIPA